MLWGVTVWTVQRDKNVSTENSRTNHQLSLRECQACNVFGTFRGLSISLLSRYLILLGIENEPPTSKELENVRQRAISKLQELGSSNILTDDLERLKSSDDYVTRSVV